MRSHLYAAGCLLLYLSAVCLPIGHAAGQDKRSKIRIFVSILPQAYLTERIGGDLIDVDVLVGPGQSPATYEPTPSQLSKLSEAELYFAIGVPFEKTLLRRIAGMMHEARVVKTQRVVTQAVGLERSEGHNLNSEPDHHHHGPDPHIWLDPNLGKLLARSMCEELVSVDPRHERFYLDNLSRLFADLDSVDARITELLAPFEGRRFYVFHPAFGHFGRAYGIEQVSIEKDGKEPSAKQLAELIDEVKRENVKVIVVQEQFSTKVAEAIAEAAGARVLRLDPLADDYLANLERIAVALASVLGEEE
jgi:zinc transport system substrate-binding protein